MSVLLDRESAFRLIQIIDRYCSNSGQVEQLIYGAGAPIHFCKRRGNESKNGYITRCVIDFNENQELHHLILNINQLLDNPPLSAKAQQSFERFRRDHNPSSLNEENLNSEEPSSSGNLEQSRDDLLKQYFLLGDRLRSQIIHGVFLAIDIAGSTKLKDGQDPLIVEYSFREYHSFVESILTSHGVALFTWAGDGSMSLFNESRNAVDAAIELLEKLAEFNQGGNKLPQPFRVRCGIHCGDVHADGSTRIERIFSTVVDIAGHLQKRAETNGLLISEAVLNEISNRTDFQKLTDEVDGQQVWKYGRAGDTVTVVESSVLFLDIVESSFLSEENRRHVFRSFFNLVRSTTENQQGRFVGATGDAAVCVFKEPANALTASRQIAASLDGLAKEYKPFGSRAGLSTGVILLGENNIVGGSIVNLAARLSSLAAPNEICLDQPSFDALKKTGHLEEIRTESAVIKHGAEIRFYRLQYK